MTHSPILRASVAFSVLLLAACASTTPAPVVEGKIQQNYPRRATPMAEVPPAPTARTTVAVAEPVTTFQATTTPTAQTTVVATPAAQPIAPLLQEEQLPAIQPAAGPTVTTPAPSTGGAAETLTHTVQPNDTLFKIARTYKTTPEAIRAANNLRDIADLAVGRTLTIPANTKPSNPSLVESLNAYLTTPPQRPAAAVVPAPAAATPVAKPAYDVVRIEPSAGKTETEKPATEPTLPTHQVQAGETIYRISRQYNVSVLDIMATNDLDKPEALQAGTVLKIPGQPAAAPTEVVAQKPVQEVVKPANPSSLRPAADLGITEATRATIAAQQATSGTRPANDPDKGTDTADSMLPMKPAKPVTETDKLRAEMKRGTIDKAAASQSGLIWPVRGDIVRRYGERGNGVSHTGINIAVPINTPVLAVNDGVVLYADGGLRNYGNMVLVRHSNGMVSAYAHNSYLLVRKGERVKKGQVIAMSGQSGNVESPQLHLELRKASQAINPEKVLATN